MPLIANRYDYDAVVVIGAARSGTRFLRSLIGSVPDFATVPFDSNHIWRIGNEHAVDDQLDAASLTPRRVNIIRRTLWRLAEGGAGARVLVEKTVSNALRLPYVASVFPRARVVHIVRDGRDAIESTYRMWMAPPDREGLARKLRSLPLRSVPYAAWYARNLLLGRLRGRGVNLWGVRYPGIASDLEHEPVQTVCARQWLSCVHAVEHAKREMPALRFLEVRYEDLIADAGQLERIAAFLNLDASGAEAVHGRYAAELQAGTGSRWQETFDPEIRRQLDQLIEPTRRKLGYC